MIHWEVTFEGGAVRHVQAENADELPEVVKRDWPEHEGAFEAYPLRELSKDQRTLSPQEIRDAEKAHDELEAELEAQRALHEAEHREVIERRAAQLQREHEAREEELADGDES